MQKIKYTSHILSLLFRSLCWLLPIGTIYFILFHFNFLLHLGVWHSIFGVDRIINSQFSFVQRVIILLIEFMPLSISVLIYHKLAKLFRLYERENLFEEENIKLIKQISILMIVGELIQLIYQPLITVAFSFNNPAGQRFASISLGSTNVSTLITAFIILVASWIVKEAHQLKSDAQLTI